MQTVLFHETIFGPIHSRRLGSSLGVNLSPRDGKACTFDCLYCEAGFNAQGPGTTGLPSRDDVRRLLEEKLSAMKSSGQKLDVITFSGNGEPTMHPQFEEIIGDTITLRDRYYPEVKISVLCNSTCLDRPGVSRALRRVDNNILKLDSAIDKTIRQIDRPNRRDFNAEKVIGQIAGFGHACIVQTMMLRGEYDGKTIDNTTDEEIEALITAYKRIGPRQVMLYSIDRKTPAEHLQKVEHDELQAIAEKISAHGINVSVT